ncbi:MAG: hypothetical protein RBT71_02680 [Flavobacteriales bacterium]|jgi:hypothetical protein|nr:hypothetical protein [Flavobacteriales bacterium]
MKWFSNMPAPGHGWWPAVLFVVAWAWAASAAMDANRRIPASDWHSNMWADASGYYVYLPGTFHHGMRAATWPTDAPERVGHGFRLDTVSDRVITKYTAGPAILLVPFYLIAEAATGGSSIDGLTPTHQRMVEVGGAFYWALAVTLLFMAFMRRWPAPAWVPLVALMLTCWGTNVIYYVVRMPMYSHVHSFFCVSAALWALLSGLDGKHGRWKKLAFHAACAMILVIRPIDAVAVAGLYAWLWMDQRAVLRRPGFWAAQALIMLLVAMPQLVYWKFAHGSWVVYSYGDEGFTNWRSPELAKLLFAPGNGWVPNAPAVLLLPLGLWSAFRREKWMAGVVGATLGAIVYLCASWHVWHFGCSYGARPLVQYMPFVALALHLFLMDRRPVLLRVRQGLLPIFLVLAFVTYRAALQFDICYAWELGHWRSFIRTILLAFFGKSEF